MVRRSGIAVAAAVMLAACGGPSVATERADEALGPGPTAAGAPDDTGAPLDDPAAPTTTTDDVPVATDPTSAPTEPDDDGDDDGDAPRPASTTVGDELFPSLGSADVDVQHYDVRLEVDTAAELLRGEVTIDAAVTPGVAELALDAVGLDVEAVAVDGAPAEFRTDDDELLVALPDGRGDEVSATVSYSVDPAPTGSVPGLPTGWFGGVDGTSFVLNEPDGARTWLPSNDHPSDKATWRFAVTVPDGLVAVANGERLAGGDGEPWVWAEREPMPTYLVQLVVGEYEVIDDEPVTTLDGRQIPIVHVVPAGERATFAPFFESVQQQLTFFEERFGPYPLARYGLAFVDDLRGVAMETQGRSMFGAPDFRDGDRYVHELLLAHELAHQWFGNAVSPAEWGDIWLNESPTTYAQWLWLDEAGLDSLEGLADEHLRGRQQPGRATADPTAEDMFGYRSYDGGAVIVHALRLELGDATFFESMSSWVADNEDRSRSTEDFVAHVESVAGRDLTAFFDAWLYAEVLPSAYPA